MKILYLVHDVGDAAVAKRAAILRAGAAEVTVAGFRRGNLPLPNGRGRETYGAAVSRTGEGALAGETAPSSDDPADRHLLPLGRRIDVAPPEATIDLGQTHNGRFLQRILAVMRTVVILSQHKAAFTGVDLILARNLEMLAIGVRARHLLGSKTVLVYESLDIHRLLLKGGPIGSALRWLEGWLSRRASALITSSPAFIREYFEPLSQVRLPVRVVENKVFGISPLPHGRGMGEGVPHTRTLPQPTPSSADPGVSAPSPMREKEIWRIGWFGAIRCRQSLALLTDLVRNSGGKVEVIIRGRPAYDRFDDFTAATTGIPGLAFHGPYANPGDLAAIYGEVHFTWAIDRFEAGQNSSWLLPNRLYEGGAFASVPIAEKAVETGRFLDRLGIGVTLKNPLAVALGDFFAFLTPEAYEKMRDAAAAIERTTWIDDEADCVALVAWLHSLKAVS